jgi:hypothetical protein
VGEAQPGDLAVQSGDYALLRRGQLMHGVPYLVYSIEALRQRHDWMQIKELRDVYDEFTAAVDKNRQNDAGEHVKHFRRRALLCPELLPTHAKIVADMVQLEYETLFTGGGVAAAGPRKAKNFEDLPVVFH